MPTITEETHRRVHHMSGVPGVLAMPCELGGVGFECPSCGGRFRSLRKAGGGKPKDTIPRHLEVIMTRDGIKSRESLCEGWGEPPTEKTPGHYPAWMHTIQEQQQ